MPPLAPHETDTAEFPCSAVMEQARRVEWETRARTGGPSGPCGRLGGLPRLRRSIDGSAVKRLTKGELVLTGEPGKQAHDPCRAGGAPAVPGQLLLPGRDQRRGLPSQHRVRGLLSQAQRLQDRPRSSLNSPASLPLSLPLVLTASCSL